MVFADGIEPSATQLSAEALAIRTHEHVNLFLYQLKTNVNNYFHTAWEIRTGIEPVYVELQSTA